MSIEVKQAAQQALEAFDAFGDADDFATMFALTQKMNALRTAIQQAESEPVAWSERDQLRHAQAAVVMPMIGPLLDAWENSDREVMSQEPELSKQLKNINSAMEDADTRPAPGVPDDVVRDAERYRWLRSLEHCNEAWCLIGSGNANSNLDAAIDAAMLAAFPAQKGGE